MAVFALMVTTLGAGGEVAGWRWLEGDWAAEPCGWTTVIAQRAPTGRAVALSDMAGAVGCWRALVELGPTTAAAGLQIAAREAREGGYRLTLGRDGLTLRDAAGGVLWQDAYAPWAIYTPYALEAVVEPGRLRVQLLGWDRRTLISQSPWLEVAVAEGALALVTEDGPARFSDPERATEPLAPVVDNAPNMLRIERGEDAPWVVVGPGEWRWDSPARAVLRQVARIERSSAILRAPQPPEGLWRCRVKVDPGAGGAGLLFAADETVESGFIAWLGGQHGAGGLMLYRLPGDALWSSPQDTWHYDTEYELVAAIAAGQVSCRLLAADGTELAASPSFELRPEERVRVGRIGFMTWLGTASFWDFGLGEATAAPAERWRILAGEWEPEGEGAVVQRGDAPATALWLDRRAAQAAWRVDVLAEEGATAVALLFQVADDLSEGFVCRLADGASLETLDGRVLWRSDGVRLVPGRPYRLEGRVETDRVRARVLDANGAVLAESPACYVSDRNNSRLGVIGFRSDGGSARFADWAVDAAP